MKTLDEVITALEDEGVFPDALNYLKTYRANQQAYEDGNRKAEEARERYLEAVKNCELAENKYRRLSEGTSQNLEGTTQITCPKCHSEIAILLPENNLPLTWDELCKMEDTPVWLEWSSDGAWVLIAYKVDNDIKFFRYCDDRCFTLTRDDYAPDKWQAYRKELE